MTQRAWGHGSGVGLCPGGRGPRLHSHREYQPQSPSTAPSFRPHPSPSWQVTLSSSFSEVWAPLELTTHLQLHRPCRPGMRSPSSPRPLFSIASPLDHDKVVHNWTQTFTDPTRPFFIPNSSSSRKNLPSSLFAQFGHSSPGLSRSQIKIVSIHPQKNRTNPLLSVTGGH